MNEDKLKELEEFCNENTVILCGRQVVDNADTRHDGRIVADLIAAYRQLEKDNAEQQQEYMKLDVCADLLMKTVKETSEANAELLEALKPFVAKWKSLNELPEEINNFIKKMEAMGDFAIEDYSNAAQAYNKHKGE